MLLFDVSGQTLNRTDHFTPASDSQEYLKAQFTFKSSEWSGKTKTALFRLGTAVYKSVLNSSGVCTVPAEVFVGGESRLARLHGSTMQVSLIGEYSTVRITTNEVDIKIPRSGYADAETPAEPTENEYTQMATVAADAVAKAEEARTACENARADLVGVKNIFANAVKGNLSGSVVFADDVSPVEHEPIVKVHGKNLFNKNNYVIIDATLMFDISMLKVGKEYVLTSNRPITWFKISTAPSGHNSVSCSDANGMYEIKFVMERNRNISASSTQYLLLSVKSNFSSNPVKSIEELDGYNIQIEEGTVATEYTPYLDPSTVCVKRCKKNLLKNTAVYQSTDGITFNMDGEGGVVCYGTSTQYVFLTVPVYLTAGRYILSGCPAGGSETTYSNIFPAGNDVFYYDTGNGVEFEITEDGEYDVYLCRFCPGVYVSGAVFKPMIRVANCTDNTFEPYNGTTYTPSSDGYVSGVTSMSPNMTILTDTAGAIVECEYIKDTNKVIERLVNAIVALGGSV